MRNPKDILIDATRFPAAVEGVLPAGAPKISTVLANLAGGLPAVPDLPIDIPAPPAPTLPALPPLPGGGALGRYVTGVEVEPAPAPKPAAPKAIVPLYFE